VIAKKMPQRIVDHNTVKIVPHVFKKIVNLNAPTLVSTTRKQALYIQIESTSGNRNVTGLYWFLYLVRSRFSKLA